MPAPSPSFLTGRQVSQLVVLDRDGQAPRVVLTSLDHIEAPNWTPDGVWLLFNGGGRLFKLPADGSGPVQAVATSDGLAANNDHVLAPDGKTIYVSARSGDLYAVPWSGGPARRVSNIHPPDKPHQYFVHGVSPDGNTLVYVAIQGSPGQRRYGIFTIPAAGGPDTPLLQPEGPVDGPEYSPDGRWIYFNAEDPARAPGHAQVYRMAAGGGDVQQLTHDERVNWFAHPSPDGQWISYLSYPAGTLGHPANRNVVIRLMRADGSEQRDLFHCFGGQGTLNVNSWAPDSRRMACVTYPAIEEAATP